MVTLWPADVRAAAGEARWTGWRPSSYVETRRILRGASLRTGGGYPRDVGKYVDTRFGPLHRVEFGGSGHPILLVHGLGGSTVNWNALGPRLTTLGRVEAIDLPGFGLTPPWKDFTLDTHRRAIETYLEAAFDEPALLVGNSMGGMLSMMVASQRPDLVDQLILVAPATPPKLPDARLDWPTVARLALQATPGVGEGLAAMFMRRHTPEEMLRLTLDMIAHKPGRIPVPVIEDSLDLTRTRTHLPWAVHATSRTASSIALHFARRSDFYAMVRRIVAPTLVIQGIHDHIVSPTSVEWLCHLRPDWTLEQLSDTGHVPILDAHLRTHSIIDRWLTHQAASSMTA